jgi:hypothetical protein
MGYRIFGVARGLTTFGVLAGEALASLIRHRTTRRGRVGLQANQRRAPPRAVPLCRRPCFPRSTLVWVCPNFGTCGAIGVELRRLYESPPNGVLMGVVLPNRKVCGALDEVVRKTPLPDGKLGGETMRKASLDQVHDLGDGLVPRRQDEVNVIRHEDVGVEP